MAYLGGFQVLELQGFILGVYRGLARVLIMVL